MSINTIARFAGALVTVVIIAALLFVDRSTLPFNIWWIVGIGVGGALLAFVFTPYITVVPYRWMREAAASDLVAAVIGLIIGLIISFLIAIPLANLPGIFGRMLPFVGTVVCGGLGVTLAVQRKNDLSHLIQANFANRRARDREREEERQKEKEKESDKEHASQLQPVTQILLDTSAIIDGRIADISQTGFVSGALLVPRFVLNELQRIADSADTMRRNRGRRGLEMLNRLQKDTTVPIEITDADVEDVVEVDGKLVKMARTLHCPIITNDFNLNRVAELQGVKVLNINELANAVKPVLLPGEDIFIKIMQDGKELGQGVGYLDDGTMIVVEGGRQFMGMTIEVSVTRVLQTVAGRMIFAHPKQGNNGNSTSPLPPPRPR
ncbi:MAG: twitching motility protein PilT [Chloroflexi bacterium 13_1_20CM_54_36]|nr:MAG: twitching motility protein PilT [Ktedonobacter sp. 13_2_20CM_2_54_8]OLD84169.1 MAG: twitching motility protein PilT [Chloroflexi bacterium 13_1_20CM_54_36]OLE35808.1 MAG: twitching motility protein PilT [Ktedonobacter sp. 13_1_20CM_3_54_15]